jgi:hypothetical protein
LGSKRKQARTEGEGKREKGKEFSILKSNKQMNSKCKFEFKHFKTMHQHVCNIKLL